MRQFLLDFLELRLDAGDDGKTFLLGFDAQHPAFAVGVGLTGATAREHFFSFGRYLLRRRFDCTDAALMWPCAATQGAGYLLEWTHGRKSYRHLAAPNLDPRLVASADDMLSSLLLPDPALPGLQRRGFEALYEMFRLPVPAAV